MLSLLENSTTAYAPYSHRITHKHNSVKISDLCHQTSHECLELDIELIGVVLHTYVATVEKMLVDCPVFRQVI